METQPTYDSLLKKVDSKYTIVVAAAKRARQLMEGDKGSTLFKGKKPVSIALQELDEGRLRYTRGKHGIK